MFRVPFFKIATSWEQPMLDNSKKGKQIMHIYTLKHYPAINSHELQLHVTT